MKKPLSVRETDRRLLQSGKIRKYCKATTKAEIVLALALLTLFASMPLFLFIIL